MSRFRWMPSVRIEWRTLLSVERIVVAVLAAGLAFFAFGNAATQIGAKLPLFKPFGPGFYSSKADLLALEIAAAKRPAAAANNRFGALALDMLIASPLSARALRNYALHREAKGDAIGARKIFNAGDAISRRDGLTQYWLINDAANRGDVPEALDHFDAILRTMPEATQPMIERLAFSTSLPDARKALTRFVRKDNPWLVRYVDAAVSRLPNVEPLALLFVDAGRAPDLPALRSSYGQIVEGLASDHKIALLRRFYPLLPDSNARDLTSVAISDEAFAGGYVPVIWDLGQSSDRGGALMKSGGKFGLELYGLPDTRGAAARKLVIPATSARRFSWVATDRSGNQDSLAFWKLGCMRSDGAVSEAQSINLLAAATPLHGVMALPIGCESIMISFEIDGGTGRDPARIVFNSVTLD